MDIKFRPAQALFLVLAVIIVVGGYFLWKYAFFKEPAPKVYNIGIIRYLKIYDPIVDGFKEGMAQAGYKEGINVVYHRYDVDKVGDVNVAAKELIQKNIDLIFAVTTVAGVGALKETELAKRTDIPIVFTQGNLAQRAGLVKSFESSGNNATGVAIDFVGLTAKKLELLKTIKPGVKKLGYFEPRFLKQLPIGELGIFENFVVIQYTNTETPRGYLIKDKIFATTFKFYFETLWKSAKP